MKKRIFIAVDISDEARDAAAGYIEVLSKRFPDIPVKWEKPEKLHLTLKFLGSTEEEVVESIREIVDRAAKQVEPFEIRITGTGAFPSVKSPRVLWWGVEEPTGTMKQLAKDIDNECARHGFEPEKRSFKPHLTLARIRDPRVAGDVGKAHAESEFAVVSYICKEIVVYESHLGRGGSTYTKLHTAKLGG